jgi:ArsR family transcriptional regulator, arsenate/arsenite/antimonite-responsive transcriptional repressor
LTAVNVSIDVDACKELSMPTHLDQVVRCGPLLSTTLTAADAESLATAFKALADPVRLQLLSLIAAAPEGSACSCDLEEPVGKSQPTVSHHLSVLADAGLITKAKRGRWVGCTIVPGRLDALRAALGS